MPNTEEEVRELARRLATAYISWQLNLKSMDNTRKNYFHTEVGPMWVQMAEQLIAIHKGDGTLPYVAPKPLKPI